MNSIDLDNQTDLPIEIEFLAKIARSQTEKEMELIVTDNETIALLNETHRDKAAPTDVLSFPMESTFPGMPLGSIVISADLVKEKAAELGHSESDELTLLFIHGLLHLLGYDHESDNGEMRLKEKALIEAFDLPSSLIIRTEES